MPSTSRPTTTSTSTPKSRPKPPILTIGLTGGIGSGKSTVAKILTSRKGFALIDADAISKSLTAPSGDAVGAIRAEFGSEFIASDNSMDRNKMRALVFEDPLAKKRLEAIIHPKILGQIESQLSLAAEQGCKTVLIDIPLLAESHARWQTRLNGVLVVDCLVQTQVKRVMERSALEEATVLKIIASQAPRDVRNALANWIIFNEGLTLDELESKVLTIDFKI